MEGGSKFIVVKQREAPPAAGRMPMPELRELRTWHTLRQQSRGRPRLGPQREGPCPLATEHGGTPELRGEGGGEERRWEGREV